MIGGEVDVVEASRSDFQNAGARARNIDRTPGREKTGGTAEKGYLHCGPVGAGHFVKMVHNGIEYGLMAAYAEGLEYPAPRERRQDAPRGGRRNYSAAQSRTLSIRFQSCRYHRSVAARQRGRVLAAGSDGDRFPRKARSCEFLRPRFGFRRRTVDLMAAIDESVPAPVLSAALYQRFISRGEADFGDKLLSAMRFQFGGHVEKKAGGNS